MKSVIKIGWYYNVELNKKAAKAEKYKDVITIIGGLQEVIKMKKRNITCMTYKQSDMLKCSEDKEDFIEMITRIGVSTSIMIF